jgi:hypothetical protein
VTQGVALAYCCAPGVVWVKDAGQTILVEQEGERGWMLRGVEAAAWDLLTLGYPFAETVHLISVLLDISPEDAGSTLMAMLRKWEGAGFMRSTGDNSRG